MAGHRPRRAAWPAIALVALTAYVLLGGADFGGGVWDLLASGPRKRQQRALIAEAIGPIWEANHVWLILVVVLLFTCFPPAFAAPRHRAARPAHADAGRHRAARLGLHLPQPLRATASATRRGRAEPALGPHLRDRERGHAGAARPLRGRAGRRRAAAAPGARASRPPSSRPGSPLRPRVGLLTLALFAFLAAVYLTLEADEPALRRGLPAPRPWRRGGRGLRGRVRRARPGPARARR